MSFRNTRAPTLVVFPLGPEAKGGAFPSLLLPCASSRFMTYPTTHNAITSRLMRQRVMTDTAAGVPRVRVGHWCKILPLSFCHCAAYPWHSPHVCLQGPLSSSCKKRSHETPLNSTMVSCSKASILSRVPEDAEPVMSSSSQAVNDKKCQPLCRVAVVSIVIFQLVTHYFHFHRNGLIIVTSYGKTNLCDCNDQVNHCLLNCYYLSHRLLNHCSLNHY